MKPTRVAGTLEGVLTLQRRCWDGNIHEELRFLKDVLSG